MSAHRNSNICVHEQRTCNVILPTAYRSDRTNIADTTKVHVAPLVAGHSALVHVNVPPCRKLVHRVRTQAQVAVWLNTSLLSLSQTAT